MTTAAKAAASCASNTCMTKLVVTLLFFRIAEYFVCFRCFLEFLFGFLVVGIFIRMKLKCLFTVCFFYLLG